MPRRNHQRRSRRRVPEPTGMPDVLTTEEMAEQLVRRGLADAGILHDTARGRGIRSMLHRLETETR